MRASEETLNLVARARAGDRQARGDLIDRYYDRWIRKFHGELGTTLRDVHSTEDIVQSALVEAMRNIGDLRNEGAFFAWVTLIIKHKIARKRRRVAGRPRKVSLARGQAGSGSFPSALGLDPAASTRQSAEIDSLDEYVNLVETVLALFPRYPRPMAAVSLRHLWGKEIPEIMKQMGGVSRRSVWIWLRQGLDLLRAELERAR